VASATNGRRYAVDTRVPITRRRDEIERVLERYGASAFGYIRDGDDQAVMFEVPTKQGLRRIRMRVSLAGLTDQEARQRWAALALVIKAKVEAIASGLTSFEEEFLAHVMLPDGSTVGEQVRPRLALAYERGEVPALLPPPPREAGHG